MGERVVIAGGGITGLVAALTLTTDHPEIDITLIEASDVLGGKLRTEQHGSLRIEAGADSFLARAPEGLELCTALGIRNELVEPAVFGGLVWSEGRLRRLPTGTVRGVPASPTAVLRARALSPAGKLRALCDLVIPGRLTGHDTSVGSLVRHRFGNQTLERLVDPLLAGTRAGNADEISLHSALPDVDRAARSHRSVMHGLEKLGASASGPPRFLAPHDGMGRLVDALVFKLKDVAIRTSTGATRVETGRRGSYVVSLGDGERLDAKGVILAIPSHVASTLLEGLSEAAANGLKRIRHASVAVITLTYDRDALRFPAASSGFLVPSSEPMVLSAGTWWSAKWPHTVSGDAMVVRAFIGRAGRASALEEADGLLAARAADEIGTVLGTEARPLETHVTRWDDGLPQYDVGHSGRISRIEGALEPHHGVVLAGADYRGTGIPDCIRQGRTAAKRVAAAL